MEISQTTKTSAIWGLILAFMIFTIHFGSVEAQNLNRRSKAYTENLVSLLNLKCILKVNKLFNHCFSSSHIINNIHNSFSYPTKTSGGQINLTK